MTVYSSISMMKTKYECIHCNKCKKLNRADGKEHGMLVVTTKVLLHGRLPDPLFVTMKRMNYGG